MFLKLIRKFSPASPPATDHVRAAPHPEILRPCYLDYIAGLSLEEMVKLGHGLSRDPLLAVDMLAAVKSVRAFFTLAMLGQDEDYGVKASNLPSELAGYKPFVAHLWAFFLLRWAKFSDFRGCGPECKSYHQRMYVLTTRLFPQATAS